MGLTHLIIDNYATAPAAATPDLYQPISDAWPDYMETEGRKNKIGYLATGVPGSLKAWAEVVTRWGRLDLETVMQPAIRYAERGFRASRYLREAIIDAQADLTRFPATARTFLPGDHPPAVGDLITQSDFGRVATDHCPRGTSGALWRRLRTGDCR